VRPGRESRTAEFVALFRALETVQPASERLFSDPLAVAFLGRRLSTTEALAQHGGDVRRVPSFYRVARAAVRD
jgi:O-methyltransferase involved in polyketide biosynthesis